MMYVDFMKIFFLPIPASWWLLDSFWHPETKNKWFLLCTHDVREFMKNFFLADSSELMTVTLILASWAKNKWFLLCRHDVRRVHEKFSSRRFQRADGCKTHFGILSSNTSYSYFVEMMYVEFMKIFFSPIRAIWWLLDSFWLPEPKNKWFLVCRHDARRVHEKFSSRRFQRADGC